MADSDPNLKNLPACVTEYIERVIRKMGYRRKVRREVQRELTDHFEDALAETKSDAERLQLAEELIAQFGDARLLAKLIRRGKKRCRPLWKKAIIRGFQAVGVFIVLFSIYFVWFINGRAVCRVNYLAQINALAQPKTAEEENAWPIYEKAASLYKPNSDDINDFLKSDCHSLPTDPNQAAALRDWLSSNEPAWQQFVIASRKKYCRQEYPDENDNPLLISILIPDDIREMSYLTRLGIWKSRYQTQDNQLDQVMEDCLTIIRFGAHLQHSKILIIKLVGLGKEKLGYQELLYLLRKKPFTAEILKQNIQQLDEIYPSGYPIFDLQSEKLVFLDLVQHLYTEGGIGGGHMTTLPYFRFDRDISKFSGLKGIRKLSGALVKNFFSAFLSPRRDDMIAKTNEIYDKGSDIVKLSPYEKHSKNINYDDIVNSLSDRYSMLKTSLSAYGIAGDMAFQSKAFYQATVTILALERWKIEKGAYPDSLQELLDGGFIQQLPQDPYSNGPLIYRRQGRDFTLYSVGADFADNGGMQKAGDPWSQKANGGDRVFWPVQD